MIRETTPSDRIDDERSGATRSRAVITVCAWLAIAVPIAVLVIGRDRAARLDSRRCRAPCAAGWSRPRLRGVLIGYSGLVLAAVDRDAALVWLCGAVAAQGEGPPGDPPTASRSACRAWSRSSCSSSARRPGAAGCTDSRRCRRRFEPSPPEEYRIVVLGGSSALGEPYRPWLSVGQIVAWQLQQAVPGRRFECEILAWLGDSLEMQHHKLAGSEATPGRRDHLLGAQRIRGAIRGGARPLDRRGAGQSAAAQRSYRATLVSPFCRLAYEIISKNRLDSPPPLTGRHQLIDPPLCSPSESADILADFRRRLEAIVALLRADRRPADPDRPSGQRGGLRAQPVDAPAVGAAGRTAAARREFDRRPRRGVERSGASRRRLRRDPRPAPGFRRGPLPAGAGCWNAAATRPRRAATTSPPSITTDCRSAARPPSAPPTKRSPAGIPRCILIDGRRELAAISPNGLIGDHVIQDTHHPTLRRLRRPGRRRAARAAARNTFPTAQPIATAARPGRLCPAFRHGRRRSGRPCVIGRACTTGAWPAIATIRPSAWRSRDDMPRPRRGSGAGPIRPLCLVLSHSS